MDSVLCCSMQKWPISKAGSSELTVKAFTAIASNTNNIILHFPAVLFLELLVAPQSYYLRRRSRSLIRKWMPTKHLDRYLSGLMRLVCFQDIWLTFTMSGFQWAVGGNVKLTADSRQQTLFWKHQIKRRPAVTLSKCVAYSVCETLWEIFGII